MPDLFKIDAEDAVEAELHERPLLDDLRPGDRAAGLAQLLRELVAFVEACGGVFFAPPELFDRLEARFP